MKELIQTNIWHEWHIRHRSPLFTYLIFYSAAVHTHSAFPFSIRSGGIALDHVITNNEELARFREQLWTKFQADPSSILRITHDMYRKKADDQTTLRSFFRDWSGALDSELVEAYETYVKLVAGYGPSIYIPLAIETLLSDNSISYLQNQFGSELDTYESIVMTPLRYSNAVESRRSLLRIAVLIQNRASDSEIDSAWVAHLEQFAFLKDKEMFFEFYTREECEAELSVIKNPEFELQKIDDEAKARQRLWQKLMDKIPDEYVRQLFLTTNESIFFRTWRTDAIVQSSWYVQALFVEIARRVGLADGRDILYLYPLEVSQALASKNVWYKKIEQRKQAYIFLIDSESNILTLEGEEASALYGIINFTKEFIGELHGTPAYRGKVKGKVLVVTDRADFPKIMYAEILVTHCTFPEMIPYLARVKAVVTEEGGILSHAALISRELKIPSVIGVKAATEVLKNGDIIEVDAERGIIQKLNSATL